LIYRFAEKLISKIGVLTDTGEPYFSFAWRFRKSSIESGASYHAQLGITPSLCLLYSSPLNYDTK